MSNVNSAFLKRFLQWLEVGIIVHSVKIRNLKTWIKLESEPDIIKLNLQELTPTFGVDYAKISFILLVPV